MTKGCLKMDENNIMTIEKLGNTASLPLSAFQVLKIAINESCDGVYYQYSTDTDNVIHEAEIEYKEDTEGIFGDENSDEMYAYFESIDGNSYFISEFLRDNYGM